MTTLTLMLPPFRARFGFGRLAVPRRLEVVASVVLVVLARPEHLHDPVRWGVWMVFDGSRAISALLSCCIG